ncbi:MAG: HigA family addiction module antidote protein [Saprospiraceae bacterium]|nr:HigA family addiction module antidote protein [Saprospiraceae bacterium]
MEKQNRYFPQSRPHPGETLSEKLEEMSMGPKEFALRTGKPEKTIIAILKGESAITPEMAVQFESVTQIPAHFWINHQRSYDEYQARIKHKAIIDEAVPWAKKFPIADMIKKGWLPTVVTIQEKSDELLEFFGFSKHTAWESYYFNQQLKVAFRISLASTKEPYAISAWLRKGELQASELKANAYSEIKFKEILHKIKDILVTHPDDFFLKLQSLCLEAGVKLVNTPTLPKAPISGCTRWLNDTPLIQISGRFKRNDSFWFTFYHEAGHILLHGKKDIFLEDIEYSEFDMQKEIEANNFASEFLLSQEQEDEILSNFTITEDMIIGYAKKFHTHPGIIIGRLHHKGLVHPSVGRQLIVKLE